MWRKHSAIRGSVWRKRSALNTILSSSYDNYGFSKRPRTTFVEFIVGQAGVGIMLYTGPGTDGWDTNRSLVVSHHLACFVVRPPTS